MKINYIFHKFLGDPVGFNSLNSNVLVYEESEFCDEKDLVFGPIFPRGSIAFINSLKFSLRAKGWPDLIWPFNQNAALFNYSSWKWWHEDLHKTVWFDDMLNFDAKFEMRVAQESDGAKAKPIWEPDTFSFFKLDWTDKIRPKHLISNSGENLNWPLWIRSNSGNKLFSGGVFTRERFLKEYEYLLQNNLTDIELVMAKPKSIGREWRLVFVGNQYVTGSQYMNKGVIDLSTVPHEVSEWGHNWATKWGHNWGGNFVLDVCESLGYKVVEINCLSSSGLYMCDMRKFMTAVKEQIEKDIY